MVLNWLYPRINFRLPCISVCSPGLTACSTVFPTAVYIYAYTFSSGHLRHRHPKALSASAAKLCRQFQFNPKYIWPRNPGSGSNMITYSRTLTFLRFSKFDAISNRTWIFKFARFAKILIFFPILSFLVFSRFNLGKPRYKKNSKKGHNVTLGGKGVTPSTFF